MRRRERRRGEKEEEGGRRDDDDDNDDDDDDDDDDGGGRRTRDRGARAAVRTAPPTTYSPGGLLAAVVVWSVRCCRFRRRFLTANDVILALSSRLHLWGDATDLAKTQQLILEREMVHREYHKYLAYGTFVLSCSDLD